MKRYTVLMTERQFARMDRRLARDAHNDLLHLTVWWPFYVKRDPWDVHADYHRRVRRRRRR